MGSEKNGKLYFKLDQAHTYEACPESKDTSRVGR